VAVYKDKLTIMKWKDKKDICLMSITRDEKLVPTRVQGQDVKKPKVAVNYNLMMWRVDVSDASGKLPKHKKNAEKLLPETLLSLD
jgi:hypothetical protein